jgi:uncharacterized protein (TIRG00374 family)
MARAAKYKIHPSFNRKSLLVLVVALLVLYAVLPQIDKFRSSFSIIGHASVDWLLVALIFFSITYLAAAAIYGLLAKKPLSYGRTLMVEIAAAFASKLLPAGIGALGLNFEYLRSRGHSQAEAGAVVATNNLIGFVGHAVLLAATLLVTSASLESVVIPHSRKVLYIGIVVAAIIVGLLVWLKKIRSDIYQTVIGALKNIKAYRNHPLKVVGALIYSMLLTSLYTLTLLATAHAVGLNVSFAQALLVLTAGVAGGTVVPTPGGLGGAEAGLFAGLVAFRASSAEALAAVLVYRLITYWLALLAGLVASLKLAL